MTLRPNRSAPRLNRTRSLAPVSNTSWAGLPFPVAFFIGISVGVFLLSKVLPPVSRRFEWWLSPAGRDPSKVNLAGAALLVGVYLVAVLAYWQYWLRK